MGGREGERKILREKERERETEREREREITCVNVYVKETVIKCKVQQNYAKKKQSE